MKNLPKTTINGSSIGTNDYQGQNHGFEKSQKKMHGGRE